MRARTSGAAGGLAGMRSDMAACRPDGKATDMGDKLDLKKVLKHLYSPPAGRFVEVEVPPIAYLMIDGHGDPNTAEAYRRAVEWLFSVSYAIKFASKKELGRDYAVMPLEGLWWAHDLSTFLSRRKDEWSWTMMIAQPEWITPEMAGAAITKAGAKLGPGPASLRLDTLEEGLCVQTMHIGSYDAEGPVLARLHDEYLPQNGLKESGHHHEIYLGDPRRTAPEKLRTILRQPVIRTGSEAAI